METLSLNLWRPVVVASSVLLASCLLISAAASADEQDFGPSRKVVAAKQVFADTAVQTTRRPLRAGLTFFADVTGFIRSAGAGLIRKRVVMNLERPPGPLSPCHESEGMQAPDEELQPALIRPYIDGSEALAALDQMIDNAGRRIDVLMYLWGDDPIGMEIASRLASRAGPHLPVRILVDGGGNLLQGQPKEASAREVNRVVCWLSHQPYVQLIRTRDPGLHFDHRKLVVVDGATAWSGGRNFTRRAFVEDHDLSLTLCGPLAAQADMIFEMFWRQQGGRAAPSLSCAPTVPGNAVARLVESGPLQRQLGQTLYREVDSARRSITIENPYLTDTLLLSKLAKARRRGVDVRVVLTLQDVTDTINRANRVTANRLLRAGVRVYIYPGLMHTKTAVVDGRWAYVGTGNFDALSLRRNHELGLSIGDGPVIRELEEGLFGADMRPEWELTERLSVGPADYLSELLADLFL
jgi:cardiolipin synthase